MARASVVGMRRKQDGAILVEFSHAFDFDASEVHFTEHFLDSPDHAVKLLGKLDWQRVRHLTYFAKDADGVEYTLSVD